MFGKTFLTACILSASAVSASAQLVAVPAPVRLPDPAVAAVPRQQAVGEAATAPGTTAAAVQPRFYTPTYYYYYYQPPYHVQNVRVAAPAPVQPVMLPVQPVMTDFGVMPAHYGTFINGRGEPGHIRYPYYSYRRPWYFPGQPGFRATIPGQVW